MTTAKTKTSACDGNTSGNGWSAHVPAVWRAASTAARVSAVAANRQRAAYVMPKTLIDIDPELLEQAQQVLGTATKKATVNTALHEVVRRWAVVELSELARAGVFNSLLPTETERLPAGPVER
jgi:Transcription regulator of the Arc/MetJ class